MEFNKISPRHKFMIRKRMSAGKYYVNGDVLSPLELTDTTTPYLVIWNDDIYTMPPTRHVPIVNGHVTLRKQWSYDRNESGKYIGNKPGKVNVRVPLTDTIYNAIEAPKPVVFDIKWAMTETAAVLKHHLGVPTAITYNKDGYLQDVRLELCGDYYQVKFMSGGYFKVFSCGKLQFSSILIEGVLSWLMRIKLDGGYVYEQDVTEDTTWVANSRPECVERAIKDLDTSHLYNIVKWISYQLCTNERYIKAYGISLIKTVNTVLLHRTFVKASKYDKYTTLDKHGNVTNHGN
jgi:hypothetical protein